MLGVFEPVWEKSGDSAGSEVIQQLMGAGTSGLEIGVLFWSIVYRPTWCASMYGDPFTRQISTCCDFSRMPYSVGLWGLKAQVTLMDCDTLDGRYCVKLTPPVLNEICSIFQPTFYQTKYPFNFMDFMQICVVLTIQMYLVWVLNDIERNIASAKFMPGLN